MTVTQAASGLNTPATDRVESGKTVPLVKIYGERNSGTIYLSELLRLNFHIRELQGFVPWTVSALQMLLPGKEAVRDAWFATTFARNLGWKHMQAMPPEELRQYAITSGRLHFLTITKNPYSWLLSMHRRPYHQYYDRSLTFEEFLTTPWKSTGRDAADAVIANPIELWNLKNRSYCRLCPESGALNLRYEDVLDDTQRILQQVEDRFQLKRRNREFRNYEPSTKDSSRDSDYYRDYYLNERWRSKLSAQAVRIINEHLDHELRQTFGYAEVTQESLKE
ncbi:MAG: hypothetical protein R3C59_03025 [Planctomycetaceae bacterium]